MRMGKKFEKILILVTAVPLHIFSLLWPKRKDLWLFGAWFGKQYADNSRYLFEEVSDNFPHIAAWWIAKDSKIIDAIRKQGRNAVHAYSLRGLFLQLRAKVFICTVNSLDFLPPLITRRNYFIQLWHGTPLKSILFQNWKRKSLRYWLNRCRSAVIDHYEMIISPNEYTDKVFVEAFNVNKNSIFRAGYPRCDALYITETTKKHIKEKFGAQGKQLWFYLPTHRSEGKHRGVSNIEKVKSLVELSAYLQSKNIVLIIKPHFYERGYFKNVRGTNTVQIWLDFPDDLYICLGAADGLVTDYSSVAFDYAILNRPIVLYAYDEADYNTHDRHLAFRCVDICENVLRSSDEFPAMLDMLIGKSSSGMLVGFDGEAKGARQSERIVYEVMHRLALEGESNE